MKVRSEKGRPRLSVQVVPLGPVDDRLLRVVAANVFALCQLPARVAKGGPLPSSAYAPQRQQYDAAALLKHLDGQRAEATLKKTIAVTAVDIFVPIFSYVFGEARLGGASALVSIYHLSDDLGKNASKTTAAELYLRAVKVALHELGHLFSMPHCEDHRCLMHYADSLEAIDGTPLQFCRYCRAEIPSVEASVEASIEASTES
jgi:archaemetzincin